MKRITLLLASLLLISCGDSKEEIAIKNYIEDFKGSKIDLNTDIKDIEEIEPYRAKDQIAELDKEIENEALLYKTENELKHIERIYELNSLESKIKYEENEDLKNIYKQEYDLYKSTVEGDSAFFKRIENKDYTNINTEINNMIAYKDKLQKNPDSIIYQKRKVTYSINNPMLNNATQTHTKIFYLNNEGTEVIKRESAD